MEYKINLIGWLFLSTVPFMVTDDLNNCLCYGSLSGIVTIKYMVLAIGGSRETMRCRLTSVESHVNNSFTVLALPCRA